jgi:hypothetical protein
LSPSSPSPLPWPSGGYSSVKKYSDTHESFQYQGVWIVAE